MMTKMMVSAGQQDRYMLHCHYDVCRSVVSGVMCDCLSIQKSIAPGTALLQATSG